MYPVAVGVIDSETNPNREWFMDVTPKNFNYCFNKILLSNKRLFEDS
jgi:hypothetical protein